MNERMNEQMSATLTMRFQFGDLFNKFTMWYRN